MYIQHNIVRLHAQLSNATKMTALPTRCLWGNISGQSTWYSQMNVILTDFLCAVILHGLLVETVRDGGIFSYGAKGTSVAEYLITP
jgi:hypothetical protein